MSNKVFSPTYTKNDKEYYSRWQCPNCGEHNYSDSLHCHSCQAHMPTKPQFTTATVDYAVESQYAKATLLDYHNGWICHHTMVTDGDLLCNHSNPSSAKVCEVCGSKKRNFTNRKQRSIQLPTFSIKFVFNPNIPIIVGIFLTLIGGLLYKNHTLKATINLLEDKTVTPTTNVPMTNTVIRTVVVREDDVNMSYNNSNSNILSNDNSNSNTNTNYSMGYATSGSVRVKGGRKASRSRSTTSRKPSPRRYRLPSLNRPIHHRNNDTLKDYGVQCLNIGESIACVESDDRVSKNTPLSVW